MLRLLFIILFILQLKEPVNAQKIRVAVAANAQFAAQLLKETFEKKTNTEIELIVSSSGKISTQIQQGAPYDVFLSADTKYPLALSRAGLTQGQPKIYAYGTLVLWTNQNIVLTKGINVLRDVKVKRIAIAHAQLAPYGEAALKALTYYNLATVVKPKLIYAESIAQVNQYILSGAADVGFTAKSVVLEPHMQGKGHWMELDAAACPRIAQSAVLLKSARDKVTAQQFYKFLYSPQAKAIFKRYGYLTP